MGRLGLSMWASVCYHKPRWYNPFRSPDCPFLIWAAKACETPYSTNAGLVFFTHVCCWAFISLLLLFYDINIPKFVALRPSFQGRVVPIQILLLTLNTHRYTHIYTHAHSHTRTLTRALSVSLSPTHTFTHLQVGRRWAEYYAIIQILRGKFASHMWPGLGWLWILSSVFQNPDGRSLWIFSFGTLPSDQQPRDTNQISCPSATLIRIPTTSAQVAGRRQTTFHMKNSC